MAEQKATNVTWHEHRVDRDARWQLSGHKGVVLWFTGLSACGKSTIANEVDHLLHQQGKHTYDLDGDNVRMGLNKNLGFSAEDRAENIRRIGEVAKLFADSGQITLTAFISPYKTDRDQVRELLEPGQFVEVFVNASLETCEARDPKGEVSPRFNCGGDRRSPRTSARPRRNSNASAGSMDDLAHTWSLARKQRGNAEKKE